MSYTLPSDDELRAVEDSTNLVARDGRRAIARLAIEHHRAELVKASGVDVEALARAGAIRADRSCQLTGCDHTQDCCVALRCRVFANAILTAIAQATANLEAENATLRALVQTNPEWRCPHGYDVPTMAHCPLGFPGCACADDRLAVLRGGPNGNE